LLSAFVVQGVSTCEPKLTTTLALLRLEATMGLMIYMTSVIICQLTGTPNFGTSHISQVLSKCFQKLAMFIKVLRSFEAKWPFSTPTHVCYSVAV